MSYTPTTEEVSGIYWWRKLTDRYGVNAVYRNHTEEEAQFDRWFAEVKAQEAKAERERIKQRLWDDGYLYEMERDHVWALIEGEVDE